MGIYMVQHYSKFDSPNGLSAEETRLGQALTKLNVSFHAVDHTKGLAEFWARNYEAAKTLKSEFNAEGNGFIVDSLIREAEEEFLPDIKTNEIARYFFHVRV